MYEFYYDVLKPKYGSKIRLAYTDTDSYVRYIETDDVYNDFRELGDVFDLSDQLTDHEQFDKNNRNKLGFFKDEVNGKVITELICLNQRCMR